jgi:hypothetical protein
MMQKPVEYGRCEGAVVGKEFRPLFVGFVGGDDGGSFFVAGADNLEEAVSTEFVDGEVAEFVDDKQLWPGIFFEGVFEFADRFRPLEIAVKKVENIGCFLERSINNTASSRTRVRACSI